MITQSEIAADMDWASERAEIERILRTIAMPPTMALQWTWEQFALVVTVKVRTTDVEDGESVIWVQQARGIAEEVLRSDSRVLDLRELLQLEVGRLSEALITHEFHEWFRVDGLPSRFHELGHDAS